MNSSYLSTISVAHANMDRTLPAFDFSRVQAGEIDKITQATNPKKTQGYDP